MLYQKVQVVVLTTDDENQAIEVFKTLNRTRMPLSTGDLISAKLFNGYPHRWEEKFYDEKEICKTIGFSYGCIG